MRKNSATATAAAPSGDLTPDELLHKEFEELVHGGVFDPKTGLVTPLPKELIPSAAFLPITTGKTPLSVDLASLNPKTFQSIVEAFHEQTKELGALPAFNWPNGWYMLGPAMIEWLLRHNVPGANREPSLGTVQYYGRQMVHSGWQPTGESIIVDLKGRLLNGQHRGFAALLARAKFVTFVVTDTPAMVNAFCHMDNNKVRNAAEALRTGNMNGTAPLLAKLVTVITAFNAGAFTCTKKHRVDRLAPVEVLSFVEQNPLSRRAAHLTAGEYKGAVAAVGHKEVVAFMAYELLSRYEDDSVCDEFMEDLEFDDPAAPEGDAGKTIRSFLARQKRTSDPLPKHLLIAYLIKGFNAWALKQPLKTLKVAADDDYPEFIEASVFGQREPEPEEAVA